MCLPPPPLWLADAVTSLHHTPLAFPDAAANREPTGSEFLGAGTELHPTALPFPSAATESRAAPTALQDTAADFPLAAAS